MLPKLVLILHVLRWQVDSGVWIISIWTREQGLLDASRPQIHERHELFFFASVREPGEPPAAGDVEQGTRAWKLFLFVPSMLLTDPLGAVPFPKRNLLSVGYTVTRGVWLLLMKASRADAEVSSTATLPMDLGM